MSVDKTLSVSYLNGVLELTVLDDPEVGTTDYEVLEGVPGLEVTRATESGKLLHAGDIIGLLVLRFHERGPGIIHSLSKLSFPGRYSVPEMGVSGASLGQVFQTLYDYYILGEREPTTIPELMTTQA